MKKLSLISMGLVLLMAMTQCKKAETPSVNDNEGEKVHITLEVDNGSKNFVHPETGNAFFTNGDKVLVANGGHYVGTLTYSSSNRHFDGTIKGAVDTDYLHFYFMGNQPLVEDTVNNSPTSFTVNISDQTNCYPQIAYNHSTAFYSESVTSYKAQLLNQCALVKFTTNEIPVETVVTVSGLNNQVSVNLGDPATFASSKVDGGKIKLHAESATSRWAILLPQEDFTGVTANALGFDEASVTFSVSSINENDYLTEGASFTMTAPALTFKARTAGVSVGVDNNASGINLQYSRDGVNWETYTSDITLENVNDIVSFRGNNLTFNYHYFTCSNGQCYIYGNVMSLLHATDYATNYELSDGAFYNVFANNQNIDIDPDKDLFLPALELAPYCYQNMFNNCTGLTTAPTLPATKLANYCYSNMFSNCSGLTTAPALPATQLARSCYNYMFYNCTGLTAAPALPATTLANYCYSSMFNGCTGLTTAPTLPATQLASNCYSYMFSGCSNLSNITCLATSGINQDYSTNNWLINAGSSVTGTKTFYKASSVPVATSGTTGQYWPENNNSGIPSGWTVSDAQ